MIEKGYFNSKVAEYLTMFEMSREFGWLPEQIRELSPDDFQAYAAMLKAINEVEREETDRMRKQLKGG